MDDHLLMEKLTLHVKVDNEDQIFSDFAYNEDNLSPELSNCLIEKAENALPLPRKENFIIKIHSNNASLRLPEITRCIHRHFHNAYDAAKRKLRSLTHLVMLFFTLGLLTLVLQFLANQFFDNFFVNEVLNITDWVFIWGAIEIVFLECRSARKDCMILRRLAYAEVAFTDSTKIDAPVYI